MEDIQDQVKKWREKQVAKQGDELDENETRFSCLVLKCETNINSCRKRFSSRKTFMRVTSDVAARERVNVPAWYHASCYDCIFVCDILITQSKKQFPEKYYELPKERRDQIKCDEAMKDFDTSNMESRGLKKKGLHNSLKAGSW